MFDFATGSQFRGWLFKSEGELAELRARAQALAKEGILAGAEPTPHSFASRLSKASGQQLSSSSGKGSVSGVKRPLPGAEGRGTSSSSGGALPSAAELEAVTAAEEAALLKYFCYMIQDACGHKSESIKRGPHVAATAMAYFRRFFLSNSMLDFDPKVALMACIFLAGKVEYEYVRLGELTDVFGEKYGRAIIDFEAPLLQGLGFHLKLFHPYNPFFGLVNGLENVSRVKKLGVGSQDLQRLVAKGQDTIDLILATDLPLLFTPARVALAVLLLAAEATGLKGPVDEFLTYCFEEEDEHGDIVAEVDGRILPLVREEVQNTPAELEERKTCQIELWKECMAKLKKASRWGSSGKSKGGGRKKSKGAAAGGDAASVASETSGAGAGTGGAAS